MVCLGLHDIDVPIAIEITHPRADSEPVAIVFSEVDVLVLPPLDALAIGVLIPGLSGHDIVVSVAINIAHGLRRDAAMDLVRLRRGDGV